MVIPGGLIGRQGETPLRLLGAEFSSRLALARASNAMLRDASGILQAAAPNALRFEGPARRALLEGQRTNFNRNPRGDGAVAGMPGTMPLYWQAFNLPSGLSWQIVSTGVEDGLPYPEIRFFGTPSASTTIAGISPEGVTAVPGAPGQVFTHSLYARLVGGSLAGIGNLRLVISPRNSAQGAIGTEASTLLAPTSAALRLQRGQVTSTMPALTAYAWPALRFNCTAGTPIEATLRLGGWQMEQGDFASSPNLPPAGSPAQSTRAADLLTVPVAAAFPGGAGTLLLAGLLPQAAVGADQTLLQIDDGTAGNALLLRNAAGTGGFLAGRVLAGAVANAAASAGMAPGTPFALGLAFDGSGLSLLLRGDSEKALATTMPTGLTTLRVGGGIGGANALFGEVGELRVLPYRASAAEMALLLASF
jgi:hypothetical protein